MLSGSDNISAYSRTNMSIWMVLAFQAGLINIGGLLACQTFVSHVTGYISLASLEIESNRGNHALSLIMMLVMFLIGSMISGFLIDQNIRENKKPKYYLIFGFLFFVTLMVAIGGFNNAFGEFGTAAWGTKGYSLAALLCFTCGVQNGMITLVSKSVVRTTHITGLVTDLGIGLVRSINQRLDFGIESETRANVMRIGIILAFFSGSLAGVPIFRTWQFRGFAAPCMISASLFALTTYFQVLRDRK